jgi:hypothetical protein
MKLQDFIQKVREELMAAENEADPFFELGDIELEISFALETEGGGTAKFVVVELGGKTTASETHKVTVTLKPLPIVASDGTKHVRYLDAADNQGVTRFD